MKKVELTKGYYAEVDDADYQKIRVHTWYIRKYKDSDNVYAETKSALTQNRSIMMHRFLTDCPKGMVVDHIDGNGLNNTQENLRICSKQQNAQNKKIRKDSTTLFKGVYDTGNIESDARYVAKIGMPDKTRFNIGGFYTPEEAAFAYDSKACEVFGEFANCNYPDLVNQRYRFLGRMFIQTQNWSMKQYFADKQNEAFDVDFIRQRNNLLHVKEHVKNIETILRVEGII